MSSEPAGPSVLDDLIRCVLALLAKRPAGEATPQHVIDSADEIAERIQGIQGATDTGVRLLAILDAARLTAIDSIPDARSCIPAMAPVGLALPELGYLVSLIARRDEALLGDAHDYTLRRAMASEPRDRKMAEADIASYSDAVALASLLDEPYDVTDSLEVLWRAWTCEALGLAEEAAQILLRYLREVDPQRADLQALQDVIASAARGNPPRAEALLQAILRLRSAAADIDERELVVMFELVDVSNSDDLAEAVLGWVASVLGLELDTVAYELAFRATTMEKQRAAAALALCGYRLTGDLRCAELAVWRLAAAGRDDEAVRLSLDAPWQSAGAESRETQLAMFQRVAQVASSEAALQQIDKRIVSLGGRSVLADQLELLPKRLSGYSYEVLSAMWVRKLWNKGQHSAALRTARDVTFRQRRGVLALSAYVDLAIEAGQFDRALELATDLHALAPAHPITSFKLAQVYKWLARDQEAEQLLRASADALEDHPLLAPELLQQWTAIDVADAIARCERALQDPAFSGVHERLRDLKESLTVTGQQHE
jgi:hypothetical protein